MASTTTRTQAREQILQLCRSDADARTLRLEVLAVLRRAIGFDAYVWLVTDPETSVGSAPLADVPCLPELPGLIRLKYLTTVNRWTSMIAPVASLRQATGGDLARSLMWRDLLCRYQIGDIATSVHRDRFGCWRSWICGGFRGRPHSRPPSRSSCTRMMFLSEHTVQDHLKSIFAKTATRTRRTLLARALGP